MRFSFPSQRKVKVSMWPRGLITLFALGLSSLLSLVLTSHLSGYNSDVSLVSCKIIKTLTQYTEKRKLSCKMAKTHLPFLRKCHFSIVIPLKWPHFHRIGIMWSHFAGKVYGNRVTWQNTWFSKVWEPLSDFCVERNTQMSKRKQFKVKAVTKMNVTASCIC